MVDTGSGSVPAAPRKRADARRNEQTLLDAAAAAFVASGVDAPVRDIAARAGVGVATIYRHFPTRADLVVAVYRHQVEACAEAGPALLASARSAYAALAEWIDLFVDFLVTKHGLAAALHSDDEAFAGLHAYFIDRLVPVCAELLDAAVAAGEVRSGIEALELMHGVGNLCIGAGKDSGYDPRRLIDLLLGGLCPR
ncbi:TetR/AcrR family transcriptional regulator [Streptacidiphilus fuscans]|uniref:TetR/AcrR family transcriptional regulator n=1 Tax=Streptacidiphilus fuscans TaxID=2789292 RepID=A0A931FIL5_9ACTN|nr:TetR/AcrR family transcriptional regulator [Streptacidiphilus fuscans]MBF9069866.1 TetR/AcrR family transcriptional regulator [Streptacidiphilus fuscans]MBF9073460.1 TetR/AcrR family transcriptional regulator [Streptacidiphilus fuscans]